MAILDERARGLITSALSSLPADVRLVFFEQALNCETCPEARRLIEMVASCSPRLSLQTYSAITDKAKAGEYGVERVPCLVVCGTNKDYGLRYYGAPVGYELMSVLETIQDVAAAEAGHPPVPPEILKDVVSPVRMRVFVTPT